MYFTLRIITYFKKTTPNFTLYRAFDSGSFTVTEVVYGPAKGVTKIETEDLYNQILSNTTNPPFEEINQTEFDTIKNEVLNLL
jgi:hypothetical protein